MKEGRTAMHSVSISTSLGAARSLELTFLFSFKELIDGVEKGNCGDFYLFKIQQEMQLGTAPLFWLGMCKRVTG